MSHRESLVEYLTSLEQIGIKLGLAQIRALLDHLGHPETALPAVVVAGTNGKGSVTAMVERGLRAAGRRTGRYTSPHLVRLEERFAIDGVSLSPEAFDAIAAKVRVAAARLASPPTFFEATTAIALEAFREARVDVAVLEVGLGGRLDATNAVDGVAVAITAIDFDHQEFLGDTIEAIAAEKAGVIKPGAVVVLGENPRAVEGVIGRRCGEVGARLVRAADGVASDVELRDGVTRLSLATPRASYGPLVLGLRGRHQVQNAITAVRLLEEMPAIAGGPMAAAAVRAALETVVWPARLESARWRGHAVLVDGAHNPAGARALQSYLA